MLAAAEARRERLANRYDGLIEQFGLYRAFQSKEERLIYRMARIFGESQFSVPAGYVRDVKRTIREYWQTPALKGKFIRSVERARANGYIPLIVDTLQAYDLPPEFFYLALVESDLDPNAVGIETRWGIAKGMWQFIPPTARRYGLDVGERTDLRIVDPQDERHDVESSTRAAARYLHYIYSTPAQASGLLVMASYNWGEHRVIKKLQALESTHEVISAAFDGIAEAAEERTYWRFLNVYEDRMPEETQEYVLRIFSAAVIGQDPRHFGFDFDDPIRSYLKETAVAAE